MEYITSTGIDGFGHQCMGIMTIIAFTEKHEGVKYVMPREERIFEHLDARETLECNQFINQFLLLVKRDHNKNFEDITYVNQNIHKHTGFYHEYNIGRYIKNLDLGGYLNNTYIPFHNLSENKHSIVIHIRGGDASIRESGSSNSRYINMLLLVLKKLKQIEKNIEIIIHTNANDRTLDFLRDVFDDAIIYDANTDVLFALSHFMFADTLVVGDSALSCIGAYYHGDKRRIIFPDTSSQCMQNKNGKHIHSKYAYPTSIHYYKNQIKFSQFLKTSFMIKRFIIFIKYYKMLYYHKAIHILRFLRLKN